MKKTAIATMAEMRCYFFCSDEMNDYEWKWNSLNKLPKILMLLALKFSINKKRIWWFCNYRDTIETKVPVKKDRYENVKNKFSQFSNFVVQG